MALRTLGTVELPAFVRQAERFADLIEGRAVASPRPATFVDGHACQRIMDVARVASATVAG